MAKVAARRIAPRLRIRQDDAKAPEDIG